MSGPRIARPDGGARARRSIERASPTDRAFLAMDRADAPQQFAVVLEMDGRVSLARARSLIAGRVVAVRRLRQRLVEVPTGCGGPIWVDDELFDVAWHVRETACRSPGDEDALMEAALTCATTPLPRQRPLWSVVLVTGLQEGRSALVVVVHHVLADGLGGLDVLSHLLDPDHPHASMPAFPRPRPGAGSLLRNATAAKVRSVLHLPTSWRLLRASMGAGGGLHPPRAARCSLLQPTGPKARALVVRAGYDGLRAGARRCGATTNDAVLVAVARALLTVVDARHDLVDPLVIAVPVSGRSTDEARDLGNFVSPLLVPVPATGGTLAQLASVRDAVRAGKAGASGPPPIGLLGWLFRPLARLGGFRWYMRHQHRLHTLVSHVRGPTAAVSFDGAVVRSAVPVVAGAGGNLTVHFEVLSYNGTITITAVIDPDHFADAGLLAGALEHELHAIIALGVPERAEQSVPCPSASFPEDLRM